MSDLVSNGLVTDRFWPIVRGHFGVGIGAHTPHQADVCAARLFLPTLTKLNEARERAAHLKCSGELRPGRGLDIIGHDNYLTEAGMFMVYWTIVDGDTGTPHAQSFESADMLPAIALMEQLRTRQRAGEGVRFVTMASENPDSVGHPGVEVAGPGYSWTKRRKRF